MKELITSFFVSFYFAISMNAQSKAEIYFSSNYFMEAIHYLEIDLQNQKGNTTELLEKLGESHYQLRNFDESKVYFEQLYASGNRDSLTVVRLFELNRNDGEYDKSAQFIQSHPTFFNKEEKLRKIDFPKANNINSGSEVTLVNDVLNGLGMGYDFIAESSLVVGKKTNLSEDLSKDNTFFIADLEGEDQTSLTLDKLKAYGVSYPSIDQVNNKIYFSASSFQNRKAFRERNNVLKLYVGDFNGQEITEIKPLPFVTQDANYAHPSISRDGQQLYFVANLPQGFGGTDIYVVQKKANNTWGEPKNCGDKINSPFNELTPYALNDTLYFSSYGHENYGGSDVFSSIKIDEEFSAPVNMGRPINSARDDFSFALSPKGEYAILTSNRNNDLATKDELYKVIFPPSEFFVFSEKNSQAIDGVVVSVANNSTSFNTDKDGKWLWRPGGGEQKIVFDHPYYWKNTFKTNDFNETAEQQLKAIKLSPVMISGKSVDDITGNPIKDVGITLFEKEGDDWVMVEKTTTDETGDWGFHVRKDREYKVEFEKDKYLTSNEIFERFNDDRTMHNEAMKRVNPLEMSYKPEKNLVMQIDNIYFDYNKASLRQESFKVLDKLISYLKKNSEIKIELSAHTDCMGKDSYNLALSQRRANSCKAYLLEKGIEKDRIMAKGYGKRKMIITDCDLQRRDDSAAQKNRRVEVKIL
jgi:outer membrane protein OmpA-like peptidoglycan-associated protein